MEKKKHEDNHITGRLAQLLAILRAKECYVTGQELAARFACSRAAIWKMISKLRASGYLIEAAPNRGYCLVAQDEYFSVAAKKMLVASGLDQAYTLFVRQTVDSTNLWAKREQSMLIQGRYAMVALVQTHGRGRRGKVWLSQNKEGLWFSLLIKPQPQEDMDIALITLFFAYCVHLAIEALCDISVLIKWPNDLLWPGNRRKFCGILTEAGFEDNRPVFLVIGCGINVAQMVFSDAISDSATSFLREGVKLDKAELLVEILATFNREYMKFVAQPGYFLDDYKRRCAHLGEDVLLMTPQGEKEGRCVDISDEGHLVVRQNDGNYLTVRSGEVSLRDA